MVLSLTSECIALMCLIVISSYHLNDIETISEFKYKMIKTQSDHKICPLDKYNIMIFDRIIKTFVDHFLFFLM